MLRRLLQDIAFHYTSSRVLRLLNMALASKETSYVQ
jgi:hypothetical protein